MEEVEWHEKWIGRFVCLRIVVCAIDRWQMRVLVLLRWPELGELH